MRTHTRSLFLALAAFCLGLFWLTAVAEDKPSPADAPALTYLDEFAGKTVKDRETAARLMRSREANKPTVGAVAPAFKLKRLDRDGYVELKELHRDKPVVLLFGSFT